MAEPYRHPATGVYYLRRQIPQALRIEFGGKALWKRSLDTKDAVEARRRFVAVNAELEARFEQARAAAAERIDRDRLSPSTAQAMVDRAVRSGGGRFPLLTRLFWAEEYAGTLLSEQAPIFTKDDPDQIEALRQSAMLPGELWLKVIASRSRFEAIRMAGNVVELVRGLMQPGHDAYADIARNPVNDDVLIDAITARIRIELADLRKTLALPFRRSASRRRPDLRLSELLIAWTEKRTPNAKSLHEATTTVADFQSFAGGDIVVATITGDMLYDFRDAVAAMPRAMPKADRSLPFALRLAKHHDHGQAKVSPASVKKRIGFLQAMIGLAAKQRWIDLNPATGIDIENYSKTTRNRRPFRDDELRRLFAAPLFIDPATWNFSRSTVSDVTLVWAFLLGLTSGARLEEIGQTLLANIKTDGTVRYLDLGVDAQVKTETSKRTIPIHQLILSLGFDEYVAALRDAGATRLFPDLLPNQFDRLCHDASRLANRVIDRTLGDDPLIVFHSLRHTFKDLGRDVRIEKYILDQIMGHAGITAGDGYGFGARLRTLKRDLDRMKFAMIDWNSISERFASVNWAQIARRLVASSVNNVTPLTRSVRGRT